MNLASFSYNLGNLSLYTPSLLTVLVGFLVGVGIFVLLRMTFLYGYGFFLIRKDASDLAKKKHTLSDLILMKDIQTELEKEIEQAMLKATFQG